MKSQSYFLNEAPNHKKFKLVIDSRYASDICELVEFLQLNCENYGVLDSAAARYGCLYLSTKSVEQRMCFIEYFFSEKRESFFDRVFDLSYLERKIRTCEVVDF